MFPQDMLYLVPMESRPAIFYFLMAFLCVLVTFIGFNFGGVLGAVIGLALSLVANIYALQIKND